MEPRVPPPWSVTHLSVIHRASSRAEMDGSMDDDVDDPIGIEEGNPPSLRSLARIDLDPESYAVLNGAEQDPGRDPREHLLARITPRELVFIEHVCLHPDQTDEEVLAVLGLRASTVAAYFAHLRRNFHVRNSTELRHWALKNLLVRIPDVGPEQEPPDQGFDPWVRWY
jgi:DNA-binding CsgD family transcriptional regulator